MSRVMLAWSAILVFLQIILGATVLSEFVEQKWIGLGVVVVAAAQGATAYYARGVKVSDGSL